MEILEHVLDHPNASCRVNALIIARFRGLSVAHHRQKMRRFDRTILEQSLINLRNHVDEGRVIRVVDIEIVTKSAIHKDVYDIPES